MFEGRGQGTLRGASHYPMTSNTPRDPLTDCNRDNCLILKKIGQMIGYRDTLRSLYGSSNGKVFHHMQSGQNPISFINKTINVTKVVFPIVSSGLKDKSAIVVRGQDDSPKMARKDLEILIATLDRRIHRAIELDQLIILSSEMLKDKLNRERAITRLEEIDESLERISSSGAENGQILHEIRIKLKGLLDTESKMS